MPSHGESSRGAAFLAGMGIGAFRRWSDVSRYDTLGDVVEPNRAVHTRYDALSRSIARRTSA